MCGHARGVESVEIRDGGTRGEEILDLGCEDDINYVGFGCWDWDRDIVS